MGAKILSFSREARGSLGEKLGRRGRLETASWDALVFTPNKDPKVESSRVAMLRWFMAFLVVGLGGVGPIVFIARGTPSSDFAWTSAAFVGAIAIAAALFAIRPLKQPAATSSQVLLHAIVGTLVAFLAVVVALWS